MTEALEILLQELKDVVQNDKWEQDLRDEIAELIDKHYDIGYSDGYNTGRYEGRGPVCDFCGE